MGLLNHFFKLKLLELDKDDCDDTRELDWWEFKDPSLTKSWTILWATHTAHLTLACSYIGDIFDPMVIDVKTKLSSLFIRGQMYSKSSAPLPGLSNIYLL